MPDHLRQPALHDLVSIVLAPTSALCERTGQVRRDGVQGVFHADTRILSRVELRLDGQEAEWVGWAPEGPHGARFICLPRWLGDPTVDPTVRVDRIRRLVPRGLAEEIRLVSTASVPVTTVVRLDVGCDLAPIDLVKAGHQPAELSAKTGGSGQLIWSAGGITVTLTGDDAHAEAAEEPEPITRLVWPVTLAPGERVTLHWKLAVDDPAAVVVTPPREAPWSRPQVQCDDRRLVRLLERSLDDVRALRLADADQPHEIFLAAGVPWFLTLFGRDSIWAARMMLPLGTDLAGSTLRVLARRQGRRFDPVSGEAPGKIMHELRRRAFVFSPEGQQLPPVYYGTIDATLLWVILLQEAWRWGMTAEEIEPLLPSLEAALGWLTDHADPDGDGFVEYLDATGRGLANQGWKDSFDAVRFRDGAMAAPPIALAEVQGYAYQAATGGAALLDAFDRPGGQRLRDFAGELARRFRSRFWIDGPHGATPALALDREKRPVDSLTSNIGHLLSTGILSDQEANRVAELLAGPALQTGYGLRTMSTQDAGFSPLSYHCGSVWTHDTAIALAGLAAHGFDAAAGQLIDGLLGAAEGFAYRMPELFSGDDRADVGAPVPYPASCRPQAWSATAAVVIVQALVGLYPDVPAGEIRLRPLSGTVGAISANRLRVAGSTVDVTVDHAGRATITGLPAHLTVVP